MGRCLFYIVSVIHSSSRSVLCTYLYCKCFALTYGPFGTIYRIFLSVIIPFIRVVYRQLIKSGQISIKYIIFHTVLNRALQSLILGEQGTVNKHNVLDSLSSVIWALFFTFQKRCFLFAQLSLFFKSTSNFYFFCIVRISCSSTCVLFNRILAIVYVLHFFGGTSKSYFFATCASAGTRDCVLLNRYSCLLFPFFTFSKTLQSLTLL